MSFFWLCVKKKKPLFYSFATSNYKPLFQGYNLYFYIFLVCLGTTTLNLDQSLGFLFLIFYFFIIFFHFSYFAFFTDAFIFFTENLKLLDLKNNRKKNIKDLLEQEPLMKCHGWFEGVLKDPGATVKKVEKFIVTNPRAAFLCIFIGVGYLSSGAFKMYDDHSATMAEIEKNLAVKKESLSNVEKNISETEKNISETEKNISETEKNISETDKNRIEIECMVAESEARIRLLDAKTSIELTKNKNELSPEQQKELLDLWDNYNKPKKNSKSWYNFWS